MVIKNNIIKQIGILAVAIILLIFINLLTNKKFIRIDLTADKIHSLSPETIDFLENKLTDVISIDIYLEGDFNAEIEKLKIGLKEKLDELKAYAGNKIKVRFIDINEDPELAEEEMKIIVEEGIYPVNILSIKKNKGESNMIWPGMIMRQGSEQESVMLMRAYDPRSVPIRNVSLTQDLINEFIDQIEYHLMEGFIKLNTDQKKRITFLRGHNELDNFDHPLISYDLSKLYVVDTSQIIRIKDQKFNEALDYGISKWDSINESGVDSTFIDGKYLQLNDENGNRLNKINEPVVNYYGNNKLDQLKKDPSNFSENLKILNQTDLLIVAKPTEPFTEKELFIIDQFIMKGGIVVWLIDLLDFDERALNYSPYYFPINELNINNDENLKNMFFTYGFKLHDDLITDINCSPIKRLDRGGYINNWFLFPNALNPKNSLLTKNVAPVKLRYTSWVEPIENNKNVTKKVILESSTKYKLLSTAQLQRINYDNLSGFDPSINNDDVKEFKRIPYGLLLEGEFTSLFSKAKGDELSDFKKEYDFETKSSANKMVVIADGDIIKNDWKDPPGKPILGRNPDPNNPEIPIPLEYEKIKYENAGFNNLEADYGNGVFFLNTIDLLLGNEVLIPLRSRMKIPRLLDEDFIEDNRTYIKYLNMIIPVVIVIILGISVWFYRNRRYGRNKLN